MSEIDNTEKTALYLGRISSPPTSEYVEIDGKEVELWVYIRFIDLFDDNTAIIEVNKTPRLELIKDNPENYSLKYYTVPLVKNVRLIPGLWNVYKEDLIDENEIDWAEIFDDESEESEEFDLDSLE